VAVAVMRCLEKNPADRWQSAEEMLHQLEAVPTTPSGGMTPTHTRPVKATGVRRAVRGRWWLPAGAAALVSLAATGVFFVVGGAGAPGMNRVAVLPIQDISGQDAVFVDAMHDQLIVALGQAGGLTVTPRSAMLTYRAEPKPMSEVARTLNVGAILEGTVFRTGDRMRINVQLVEPHSIAQLWGHSYEIDARDVLGAQDSVVRQIVAGVREVVVAPTHPTPSP